MSMFGKKGTRLTIIGLLVVSLMMPAGFAVGETSAASGSGSQMVEKSADSWRFDDGMIDEAAFEDEFEEEIEGEVTGETDDDAYMDENAQMGSSTEEEGDLRSQPMILTLEGDGNTRNKSWKWYDGSVKKNLKAEGGYLKGIDISKWQGDINWDKVEALVKAGKLDFVIIRCGFGANLKKYDDSKWYRNANACRDRGIPFGVYLYSYADSVADARDEAKHALRLLEGYYPDYPVYYDLEDKTVAAAGNANIRKMAKEFCGMLTDNGYRAGIYANKNWWETKLNVRKGSTFEGYDKWMAYWTKSTSFTKYTDSACSVWQCSSWGKVDGISGRVDINLQLKSGDAMDKYMEGAYKEYTGPTTDVEDYEAYVTAGGTRTKNGPGSGFLRSVTLEGRTKITITETARGYGKIGGEEAGEAAGKWVLLSALKRPNDVYGMEKIEEETKLVAYDGTILKSRWYTKNGCKYYFGEDGAMYTGTRIIKDMRYVFLDDGRSVVYKAKIKRKINTRKGPGTKYAKTGTLTKNRAVTVVRISGKWSRMDNGKWFMTRHRKNTSSYPKFVPYKVTTTKKVTYRSGAGTKYKKRGTYPAGKVLTIVRWKNGWGNVKNYVWIPLNSTERN
jgi:GH25 family lysozyme M1 (1,4-beta-N-acetylmuramidase)